MQPRPFVSSRPRPPSTRLRVSSTRFGGRRAGAHTPQSLERARRRGPCVRRDDSKRLSLLACLLTIPALLTALLAAPAAADPVADFYRGKSLTMIIATSPGGDYDIRARLVARHLGRHIPGEPTIIARNMPGAVGLQAANYLAVQAPRDGTVLHAIMQAMSAYQAMGGSNVEYDTRKLFWIGNTTNSPNVVNSWYTTGIKTIQDVMERELVVGAPGTNTPSVYYPRIMNALAGTKFKIVTGYPGGNDVDLAMERGEVAGRCGWSWTSVKGLHQSWLDRKEINILYQMGLSKHRDLPDVPLIVDLARTDEERAILRLIFARQVMAWPFLAPPGTPGERVDVLRKAFLQTMQDGDFLAEAGKAGLEITPVAGADIQKLVQQIYATPAGIARRAAELLQ